MQSKAFFLNILLGLALAGCTHLPKELENAQKLLDSKPDSALDILQHPPRTYSDANRALYGILLFQALDKNNKTLQPDSTISFSIRHYEKANDKQHLAIAYYYKARLYKRAQQFDKATELYLKALDLTENETNLYLLGKIYSDMADLCAIQKDFTRALRKYNESMSYYKNAGDTLTANSKIIDIARMYFLLKDNRKARWFYKQSLSQSSDSFLRGMTYQEIGINYYFAMQYDSAKYFLNKSLHYPYKGTSYAIRCYILADLCFDINQFDSAFYYASLALQYPSTFFNQRDCYRILANTKYMQGDFKSMGKFMTKYQDCTDSVRKIEAQTKTSVLEDLHQTNGEVSNSRQSLIILGIVICIITMLSLTIVFSLRKRSRKKEMELGRAKETINEKQILLRDNLIHKIAENRAEKASELKKGSVKEREVILLEIYNRCLQLENWNSFSKLMNQTFNDLILTLEINYPELNQKEIVWVCLFLLHIPLAEMALILDCQMGSLYKLKQRVAQKMNLSSTKELELVLQRMSNEK